jgi:DNA-binding MarR family transcriptional regulator
VAAVNAEPPHDRADRGRPAADRPDHVVKLMGQVFQQLRAELARSTLATHPGVRGSHIRVLSLIPTDGARMTDLAARVDMTKQALGEFVAYLAQRGYLTVDPDPADGRARLVRRTARGEELKRLAERSIGSLEARWQRQVGTRRYATFKAVLRELADASEPGPSSPRPPDRRTRPNPSSS